MTSSAEARRQIEDALLSYTRGIDRLDAGAVAAGFHAGAELVDYGADAMTIETFVTHAMGSLEGRFSATQHRMSNTAIEFNATGDAALVETYVLAFHIEPTDDGDQLHTFNGRYIDDFEVRDGVWKIARRTLRTDWSKVEPVGQTMRGAWKASGRAGSPDPLVR